MGGHWPERSVIYRTTPTPSPPVRRSSHDIDRHPGTLPFEVEFALLVCGRFERLVVMATTQSLPLHGRVGQLKNYSRARWACRWTIPAVRMRVPLMCRVRA